MEAYAAFEARQADIRERLLAAKDPAGAVSAATMAMEQIAAELAQEESDGMARQRQQAVLAALRRAPVLLRAPQAQGRLILDGAQEKGGGVRKGLLAAGALLLGALALFELIDGRPLFAALQIAGAALLALGGAKAPQAQSARAEATLTVDADALLRALGELCRAADVCVSDLALLERDGAAARLSGEADEAMLDLLVSLLEARATGRADVALRSLDQAETYLRRLGVTPVWFERGNAESARMFDLLPTLSGERTIRPALMKDGRLIRRGVAACAAAVQAR